jgi:hypothetical protein
MWSKVFVLLIILLFIYDCFSYIPVSHRFLTQNVKRAANMPTLAMAEGDDEPYQKWVCPSCSYVYDEEKGFKKRYPAGTRWRDIEVFLW